jgi:hypothetical protein
MADDYVPYEPTGDEVEPTPPEPLFKLAPPEQLDRLGARIDAHAYYSTLKDRYGNVPRERWEK